jgi:rhodanese-related sulfurtransferase
MSLVTPLPDDGLGNTSWLVDLGDQRVAAVDPGRHPGPFLAEAERRGVRVAFSIETHLHADFVTGSRELAVYGTTVVAPAAGGLAWPHRPVNGGEVVDLGGLSLRALSTPGHTPEHLAYREAPLVFVLGADQDRSELVRQCHQIGYDRIVGELTGGMTAWSAAGMPAQATPLGDVTQLPHGRQVLDVRQAREHAEGHVPGVTHVELGRLPDIAGQLDGIDAVMCGHGERAATAASILERAGRPGVTVVVGGLGDWADAGHEPRATG